MNKPYLREFGPDYEVPTQLETDAFEDWSYHNDTSPSFVLSDREEGPGIDSDDEYYTFRIWVNHPDPVQREDPQWARFIVGNGVGELGFQTNSLSEAIAELRRLNSTVH